LRLSQQASGLLRLDPLPGNPEGRQDSDKPEAYATT